MPTTNPVPSQDPSDLLFNAGKLDEVLNGTGTSFTDRLGTARRTVAGMNADFDAQLADAESDLNVYRADAAASAAQALGYLNTIRTTSYGAYAGDPATDPLGNPPTVGDEYFNTPAKLLKRWNGTTWQASDINTANLAASSGSSLVGYDGQTVQDVLDAVTGPTGAASVGYTPAGAGAEPTNLQEHNRQEVSLFNFMTAAQIADAKSRAATLDCYSSFVKAIDYLKSIGGGTIKVPVGAFRPLQNVDVPSNINIVGKNRAGSVIDGVDKSHIGFTLTGNNAVIEKIFIRGMSIGVSGGAGRYCKLKNCNISYNRIGVDWLDGYLNTVTGNNIMFNTYGSLLRGQSFQLNFYDNVVDNNLGGLGILVLGSSGAIIQNNTIEGNRIVATGQGVGLFIAGLPQRLVVDGNWFEVNGTAYLPGTSTPNDYSSDIIVGDGVSTIGANIVAACIPSEYQTEASVVSAYGSVDISNNFHYSSRHGVISRFASNPSVNVQIHGMRFNGDPGRNQKPIFIEYVSGGSPLGSKGTFDIHNNEVVINGSSVPTELLGGANGSYVWCNGNPPLNLIRVDGVDLFTKRMTCEDFLAMPGATLSPVVRLANPGAASLSNEVRSQKGSIGVITTEGTGRLRVGASSVLAVGQKFVAVVIAKQGSTLVTTFSSGGAAFGCVDANNSSVFNIIRPSSAPTVPDAYLGTGEYYGYCIMTEVDAETYLKSAKRIELTDLKIVSSKTYGTAAPSSASQNCFVNDIVWNSAPTAGGILGWVCVAAGAPGTWKSFGAIAA